MRFDLRRRALIAATNNYNLPPEYQQVEYIASTSAKTQYIDLDYSVSSNTEIYLKVLIRAANNNWIFGTSETIEGAAYYYALNGYKGEIYGRWGTDTRVNWGNGIGLNHIGEYYLSNGTFTAVNYLGNTYSVTSSYTGQFTMPNSSLKIFAFGQNNRAYMELYDGWLKENGVLSCMPVPCYHKQTGDIGVYDVVRRRFFTNAGTGAFTKGADV